MLPLRRAEFGEHFQLMDYMAAKYNVAWLLTCQVMGIPDPGKQLGKLMKAGMRVFPVGGHFLLHSVNTWVSLQQIKSELWKAVLFDSSYLPRGSCEFVISKRGILDGVR